MSHVPTCIFVPFRSAFPTQTQLAVCPQYVRTAMIHYSPDSNEGAIVNTVRLNPPNVHDLFSSIILKTVIRGGDGCPHARSQPFKLQHHLCRRRTIATIAATVTGRLIDLLFMATHPPPLDLGICVIVNWDRLLVQSAH